MGRGLNLRGVGLQALILDFGNVLTELQGQAELADMSRLTQADPEGFVRGYWKYRPDYDHGMPVEEYWRRVMTEAGAGRNDVPSQELTELDLRSWTHYRDSLWALTQQCRQAGNRTAMLTNNFPSLIERIDSERPFATYFDAVVVSYQVGVLKPHRRIYEVCLEKLNVPPEACLFVDDRQENVVAAQAIGMHGIVFTEADGMDAIQQRICEFRGS